MNHNKEFTSLLAQTAEITRGRIHRREVYRDFYRLLRIKHFCSD